MTLDDIVEYNKVKELADLVKYHSRLMSYYGLDLKTGKWNTKQFPVTQTDAQMQGINSDTNVYNKAVKESNDTTICSVLLIEMNDDHNLHMVLETTNVAKF